MSLLPELSNKLGGSLEEGILEVGSLKEGSLEEASHD